MPQEFVYDAFVPLGCRKAIAMSPPGSYFLSPYVIKDSEFDFTHMEQGRETLKSPLYYLGGNSVDDGQVLTRACVCVSSYTYKHSLLSFLTVCVLISLSYIHTTAMQRADSP